MQNESYPEGIYEKVTIALKLDAKTGVYEITCPEWKYETYSSNPAHVVLELVREIMQHNQYELEEVD